MSCISHLNLCPSSGDTENVLLQKILQSVNAGGGVAGVSSISVNGGAPQTGAVSISTGGTVTSVNGDPGPAVSLDSGEIPEGANLYFTNARAIASTLTGFVAAAGTVTAADSILTALQKSSFVTNDLLNFRDTNAHADASIYINSGATEIIKVIGSTTFVQLNSGRIQRDVTNAALAILGGTAKGTGAYIELHGDTSAGNIGLAQIITKGRATGEGNFRIFNAALGSSSADVRAEMRWEGSWTLTPVWNDGAVTFTGLKLNLTDTASAAASLLFDLQVSATSKFNVAKTGLVGIGVVASANKALDIVEPSSTIRIRSVTTDVTNKNGFITVGHYTNSEEDILIFGALGQVSNNGVFFGGGSGSYNAATEVSFWTAANNITLAGTRRLMIASSGSVGIGPSLTPSANLDVNNSVTATKAYFYETTDGAASPSNYSRSIIQTQAGNHLIRTEAAGTGTLRILQVGTGPKVGTDIAGANAIFHGGQSTGTGVGGSALIQVSPAGGAGAGVNALVTRIEASNTGLGFFAVAPVAKQVSGANLTNNVTAGGTDDTIANFTDLTIYANDAAAIRNDIYQLARKLKQVNDALRLYGLLT